MESFANQFILRSPRGKVLFSADDQEVHIGAEKISVSGKEVHGRNVNLIKIKIILSTTISNPNCAGKCEAFF